MILLTNVAGILRLPLGSFLGGRFRRILLRLSGFFFGLSFLFAFRGFVCRGGLNGIYLGGIPRNRLALRSILIRGVLFLLPRVHGQFLR